MPIYTFYNKKTKKQFDDMMTIAEMEKYLKKNKHISQVLTGLNIVASVGNRTMKTFMIGGILKIRTFETVYLIYIFYKLYVWLRRLFLFVIYYFF